MNDVIEIINYEIYNYVPKVAYTLKEHDSVELNPGIAMPSLINRSLLKLLTKSLGLQQ